MKQNSVFEIVSSVAFIILTLLILNPFNFWMPTNIHMMVILGFIILYAVFATFIWKEKSRDEREQYHRATAGRVGFLFGTAVLVAGIVYQSLRHILDPWLIIALTSMIIGKIIGFIYSEVKN